MTLKAMRLLVLLILVITPAWIFANDKHKMSDSNLASQIQERLQTVAPNTVVVVVDEDSKTAFVRGSVNNQSDVERITESLRQFDGIRVIGSNLVVNGETSPTVDMNREIDKDRDYNNDNKASTLNKAPTLNETPEDQDSDTSDSNPVIAETIVPTDASVNAAVIQALTSEGIVDQSKIRVDTEGGVVTLTGTALSEAQADRIVELARSVPGVIGINTNIQLGDEKRPYKVKASPDVDKEGQQIDPDDDEN